MLTAVDWADELPCLVGLAAERFQIELDGPIGGGRTGLVLAALSALGEPVVLKLSPPLPSHSLEAAALDVIAGRGAVQLRAAAPELGAMLLERAEPGSRLAEGRPLLEALTIGAAVAARTHVELDPSLVFPTANDYLARLALELPLRHVFASRALPLDVLDGTLDACGRLAVSSAPLGLANAALRLDEIIAGQREQWLLLDPEPHRAEVAFSAGEMVRTACRGLAASELEEALAVVSTGVGTPVGRVRDWALVRAAAGVYETGDGADPDADRALALELDALSRR